MSSSTEGSVKVPSYRTLLLICCTVCFFCYFGSYMRIPVVPLFARSLGADTIQVGLINSSFLLMAGLLSLPLGILSDRVGRRILILSGLLISCCSSFLFYYSRTPVQMMLIYLFFGVGLAAFAPTLMSFVADFTPSTHLGRSYGWYTTALYGGMSLGPAAGGFAGQWLGFPPVFLLSGTFILLMVFVAHLFVPRAHQVPAKRPRKRAMRIMAGELLRNRPLLSCWMITLGGCFGLGMFVTFVPLHAQEQGLNLGQIGIVFAAQALFNALSRIPFGYLSDRVSDRSVLVVIGMLCFAVSMAGIGFSTHIFLFLIWAVTLGISMGIAFTALGALISEVVSPDSRGLAMGGYNTCIYLGMMLSAVIMGIIIRETGYARAFLLTGTLNLIPVAVFYIATRRFIIWKSSVNKPED